MKANRCSQISKTIKSPIGAGYVDRASMSDIRITSLIAPDSLEHLFQRLPIEAVWVAFYDPMQSDSQRFLHAMDLHHFTLERVAYLASEQWLVTEFPLLTVCDLNLMIPFQTVWSSYICTFQLEKSPGNNIDEKSMPWGYWLLWARQPLAPVQKYCIEQQVRCFQVKQQSLLVQSHLEHQIQSLKQTLYQTEHQLRTPLSLLEIYANLLHQSAPAAPLKEQAQCICKTVNEINTSLKCLTRGNASSQTERTQCDLKQIAAESIEELQLYLDRKSIRILCNCQSLLLTVDFWQIKQVFKNLFNNAIAFSPEGSAITCQWQIYQNEVLIEICDQGPGFSADDLDKVFTPFYSRRRNGTGLGLVIARDMVQAHQGRLWVDNLPSGGANISIALPRV